MTLQKSVGRQYTQGFVGEISQDGPVRAKPARIVANGTTPNRIGRAFTYDSELGATGTTIPYIEFNVKPGGTAKFVGILSIPKHYTLYGNVTDGPLGPSIDLPAGAEGEFVDMAILNLSVSNGNDTAQAIPYGTQVYYAATVAAAAAGYVQTTQNDLGRLYVFPGTAPADGTVFRPVPGAFVSLAVTSTVAPATPNPTGTATATDTGAVAVRVQITN